MPNTPLKVPDTFLPDYNALTGSRHKRLLRLAEKYGRSRRCLDTWLTRIQSAGSPSPETTSFVPDKKEATQFSGGRRSGSKVDVERSVFLNDVHCPFHDVDACRVALDIIAHINPAFVFLNGDLIDFYALSRFDKDPKRILQLQEELDCLDDFLGAVRDAAGEAEIVYIEGNHEHRLTRWVQSHPEVSSLRSLTPQHFLGLANHDISWVPRNRKYVYHGVTVTHGEKVRSLSAHSARAEYDSHGTSGISGHTHRAGTFLRRDMSGSYIWIEGGCLCDLSPEYCSFPDWQHAIAVGTFIVGDDRFQIEQVHMPNKKALYDGLLFG